MRAASRLFGTPGGEPQNLRVSAGHPEESGCGAHECARHGLPRGILYRLLNERPERRERRPHTSVFRAPR